MKLDSRDHQEFFDDLDENRYHIFSRRNAAKPGFYPNAFPAHPEIAIEDVREGDLITVRAFFAVGRSKPPRIDSGEMTLEVEWVDRDERLLVANILTDLPQSFPLAKGTSIELDLDEVLIVHRRRRRG
ncbi:MAG: hypothetical protein WD065_08655 [Planctomycetaceae bacterium]